MRMSNIAYSLSAREQLCLPFLTSESQFLQSHTLMYLHILSHANVYTHIHLYECIRTSTHTLTRTSTPCTWRSWFLRFADQFRPRRRGCCWAMKDHLLSEPWSSQCAFQAVWRPDRRDWCRRRFRPPRLGFALGETDCIKNTYKISDKKN